MKRPQGHVILAAGKGNVMDLIDTKSVVEHYYRIMSTEERLKKRQRERDSRELDAEIWIVHDKDDGSVVGAASTKTMAVKRACAFIYRGHKFRPSWKRSWLDTDLYAIREYRITPKEEV